MAPVKKKKAPLGRAPASKTGKPAKSAHSADSEVGRRWTEYWSRRTQLEEAVARVRAASDALKGAQEQEKLRRAEFDEVRRSLTKLLDVDPVATPPREPIPIARNVAEGPPKQVG